jgi:hypothetical protein
VVATGTRLLCLGIILSNPPRQIDRIGGLIVKRALLRATHAIGSDVGRIIGGGLALVSGVAAIADAFDDRVGFPSLVYVGAGLIAAALVIIRPVYARLFTAVDQEKKEFHAQQPHSVREEEQRQTLRDLQDLMPRFSTAARAIYEERRGHYLQSKKTSSEPDETPLTSSLREHFKTVSELDQTVLNLISRALKKDAMGAAR